MENTGLNQFLSLGGWGQSLNYGQQVASVYNLTNPLNGNVLYFQYKVGGATTPFNFTGFDLRGSSPSANLSFTLRGYLGGVLVDSDVLTVTGNAFSTFTENWQDVDTVAIVSTASLPVNWGNGTLYMDNDRINYPAPSIVAADLDGNGESDVIVNFGSRRSGIWVYYNNSTWVQLHSITPKTITAGNIDGDISGKKDLVVDFGPQYGIWVYYNNSYWAQLHTLSVKSIIPANLDANPKKDLIIDFGPQYGIWIYYNNSTWQKLHQLSSGSIAAGDLDGNGKDEIIVNFGPQYGIWIYYNNTTWVQLHSVSPKSITVGNIDSDPRKDLIIDFGYQYGIWIYANNSNWQKLHTISTYFIATGDMNGNGTDEIIVDFGPQYGIWIYHDDGTWSQLYNLSSLSP